MRPGRSLTLSCLPFLRLARSLHCSRRRLQRSAALAPAAAAAAAPPSVAAPPAATQHNWPVSWPGLREWRASGVDGRTAWGHIPTAGRPALPAAGAAAASAAAAAAVAAAPLPASLAECGRAVLLTADPHTKAALSLAAWTAYTSGLLPVGTAEPLEGPPARPAKPELVPPRQVPSMEKAPLPKPVYQLHNLTHVELNAVDLAWDTVVRFSSCGLPEAFFADFARVAADESRHLSWCLQRLDELGYHYGCMVSHDLLWEGCQLSQHDLGARLAIVPMSQEARGLDAGDRLFKRLVGMGDNRTAAIVKQIATEERAHVAVGIAWFSVICDALGMETAATYQRLLLELCPRLLKGPFDDGERQAVGLERELYSTAMWDPALQQAAAEAIAAAERGHPPAKLGSPTAVAPLEDVNKLQQLASRLADMLDIEMAAARQGAP